MGQTPDAPVLAETYGRCAIDDWRSGMATREISDRQDAPPSIASAEARADAVPGSWMSARIYDPSLWLAEKSGMAELRRSLVTQARGAVLEIGAGTGLNLAHYPHGLDRLILCEPDRQMAQRLTRRAARLGRNAQIVRATAESLPFDDETFDTVVSTLVLCTVADPESSLDEIRRVLRSDGALLFLEHVRSDDAHLARWQDRLQRPWGALAGGCACNRRTLERLGRRGYAVSVKQRARWRWVPPIVRPLVAGRATPRSAGETA
jgi:SAM-dependent methyltransferase